MPTKLDKQIDREVLSGRRVIYEDMRQQLENTKKQRDLLLLYLYDTVSLRPPDANAASQEGHYGATMYRCTTGSGGYIVLKPFGCGTPSVHYLDDIDTKWPAEIRSLAERLRIQRKKICDQEDLASV